MTWTDGLFLVAGICFGGYLLIRLWLWAVMTKTRDTKRWW